MTITAKPAATTRLTTQQVLRYQTFDSPDSCVDDDWSLSSSELKRHLTPQLTHAMQQQYMQTQQSDADITLDAKKITVDAQDESSLLAADNVSDGPTSTGFAFLPAGSIRASIFNLSSATLGAGALSLPYAFECAGLIPGVCLLLCGYLCSCYSIELLIRVHRETRADSYETIGAKLYSRPVQLFINSCILLFCFGTCVAYIVAAGDIAVNVMNDSLGYSSQQWLGNRTVLTIIFVCTVMLPLSCLEAINSLRFTSFLGVSAILALVAALLYRTIQFVTSDATFRWSDVQWFGSSPFDFIQALSIVLFAYTCQPNVLQTYMELQPPTASSMRKVVGGSFGLSTSVYLLIGVSGMIRYGKSTQSDILSNIDAQSDPLMAITQFGLALAITLAYPLNVFPARAAIEHILSGSGERYRSDGSNTPAHHLLAPSAEEPAAPESTARFYSITLGIVFSSLLLALTTDNLSVVFSLIGSTTSAIVCFILPPAFYLCATSNKLLSGASLMAWALLASGVAVGVIATSNTILDLMH